MNIVFDLGGVLLRWEPKILFEENYSDKNKREILQTKFLQNKPLWNGYDKGVVETSELFDYAESVGLTKTDIKEFFDIVCRHLILKQDMVDIVCCLSKQKKHKLFVLSNMGMIPAEYVITNHNIWGLFDGIVFSCDVKLIKPERAIYEHILSKYKLQASETVFIDDLIANIEAATALGIKAIHFKSASQVRNDLEAIVGKLA
jgi:putative hydrolase of the HAD superfamily